ncbi:hypothetical protein HK096_008205 [Nowakowskiella sp. JEL0078]|nr:hypothetical protein HK096_008205 [Nowakowskiella sp. JEL0078]
MKQIPSEILLAIFQQKVLKRKDLLSCAYVCHHWFSPAVLLLWEDVYCFVEDWPIFSKLLASKNSPSGKTKVFSVGSISLLPKRDLLHLSTQVSNPSLIPAVNGSLIRSKLFYDYRPFVSKLTISPLSTHAEIKLSNLRMIIPTLPRLTHLRIDIPALSDDDLWVISKSCTRLQSVFLHSLATGNLASMRISDEGVCALFQNCVNLVEFGLVMHGAVSISDRSLLKIIETRSNNLTSFHLEYTAETHNTHVGNQFENQKAASLMDFDRVLSALEKLVSLTSIIHLTLDLPYNLESVWKSYHSKTAVRKLESLKLGSFESSTSEILSQNRTSLKSLEISEYWEQLGSPLDTVYPQLYKFLISDSMFS